MNLDRVGEGAERGRQICKCRWAVGKNGDVVNDGDLMGAMAQW